jgi:predicted enzyme related to lactoylglutathione lyase
MNAFCRYELRTTDVEGAHAFYTDVFGADFWSAGIDVRPLPAPAVARGAPPHWLGHIHVDDVVGTMLRFVGRGAAVVGPRPQGGDAAQVLLRDPFSAMVALTSAATHDAAGRVAWHLLTARDEHQAFAVYEELFGWHRCDAYDLGQGRGRHVSFTWDAADQATGSISNLAQQPHVHPQWLYFFRTARLEDAVAKVRAHGGLTLPAVENGRGDLVAVCDDPQGAAFALYEFRAGAHASIRGRR